MDSILSEQTSTPINPLTTEHHNATPPIIETSTQTHQILSTTQTEDMKSTVESTSTTLEYETLTTTNEYEYTDYTTEQTLTTTQTTTETGLSTTQPTLSNAGSTNSTATTDEQTLSTTETANTIATTINPLSRMRVILSFHKISDDELFIDDRIVFGIFNARCYRPRDGKPFNIHTLAGPNCLYDDQYVVKDGVSSVTYFFPLGDERPFIMSVEKIEERREKTRGQMNGEIKEEIVQKFFHVYRFYYIDNRNTCVWKEENSLKPIVHFHDNVHYLEFFKKVYRLFFKTELDIHQGVFLNRGYNYDDVHYYLDRESSYCPGYDKYTLLHQQAHSVWSVFINGVRQEFDVDIRFVNHFSLYVREDDWSTILMIGTEDYELYGNRGPFNYYTKSYPTSKHWTAIEGCSNLDGPLDPKALEAKLDDIALTYSKFPVTIRCSKKEKAGTEHNRTKIFDGVPFDFFSGYNSCYTQHTYVPVVSKTFTLKGLEVDGEDQNLNFGNAECSYLIMFYLTNGFEKPVLMCIGFPDPSNKDQTVYYWYSRDPQLNYWRQTTYEDVPNTGEQRVDNKAIARPTNKKVDNLDGLYWAMAIFLFVLTIGIVWCAIRHFGHYIKTIIRYQRLK